MLNITGFMLYGAKMVDNSDEFAILFMKLKSFETVDLQALQSSL